MDEATFWKIISSGRRKAEEDQDAQLEAIHARLAKRSPEEIQAFHALFWKKIADAYAWNLWGAAYLINGGCSDDGFCYFRAWLIAQGREVYEAAVANPDTLAGRTDPERDDYELEEMLSVARDAYEGVTGEEMPSDAPDPVRSGEPRGERWDFDDDEETRRRLPRLAAIYVR